MATLRGIYGIAMFGANEIAEVTGWTMDESGAEEETSVLNSAGAKRYEASSPEASGNIECYFADDTDGQNALTVGATGTLNLYTAQDVSGTIYYSVPAVITARNVALNVNGRVTRSFSYKSTGAVVENTVP